MSDATVADDQITVRTIKTRHRDALRDLQQIENDRLSKIKNDPSRRVSRGNPENDTDNDLGAKCIQELLPVKQVWAGALEASRLTVGNRLALTRRDLLSHYDAVGAGHVASKICHLEKLIILISSTREKVDTTVKAGHKRISQIVSAAPPPGTIMVPAVGDKSEDLSLGFDQPEIFRSGSTQAYQKSQLDANSIAVLTELICTNNGKPLALSCGVYSDQDTLEQPIDVTAVAMVANGILYVALTIDPLAGHEMDKNAYGVKKVKVFTSEQSVNVLERIVEIVPPHGTRFPSPPPASTERIEEDFVSNLDLKFRGAGAEKERGSWHCIDISEVSDDDDDSDGDMGDDDDDDDDGESDSSGDSEGDQDLALFLVETGNVARSPVPALRRRSLDSLTGSLLGLKTSTRTQGTNTSLYNTGYQSKCMLGSDMKSDMKSSGEDMDMSLPDCSCRRIRCFDLEEVKSVTCSSTSFVLQRGSDAVAFKGSLQSAITESLLDAKFLIVGDTSFQWTRSAAASGWMSKQPTTLSSASSSSKGDAGAGAGFVKGDKANRRFLSLRDNTLRYDSIQTLSMRSHGEACASDSVLLPLSPSSSPRPSLSPAPSLSSPAPHPASPIPSGMLKVIGDKTSPKVSQRKGDLSTPSSLVSPTHSSLSASGIATARSATTGTSPVAVFAVPPATPVDGTSRTLSSHISSMFSKKSIKHKEKSPAKPRVNRLAAVMGAFGGRRKDRHTRDASGVIDITHSSTVTTRCSNPRPGVSHFITLETAKETLRVCYEHMDPPPALPFGHQGYDELHSSVSYRRSVSCSSSKSVVVDSKRDTVHAHWVNEMRRSIAQQTKKPLLLTRNRMESEWSHESTGFLCVAVDAVVEPLQHTSPSPPLSRNGSEARDECDTDGAEGDSGIKCTHAALYCMRTIKHSFTQKVLSPSSGCENVPCDTTSKSAMSKERVSSALLGDYSAKVEQTLAAGNRTCRVGMATQSEEDATGRTLSAGAGVGAGADSKNSSTREDVDAVMVTDNDEDANMGMVNNAYYVCVGFVTSAGEAQSTQLIKVLNEKFNSNLGTDLTCMLQCGDILVFGGAHGFVGIGVGVPHTGGSNEDHESSVAIVCVFPTGFPASSSTHAHTSASTISGAGESEREREKKGAIEWLKKIEREGEGENVNGSTGSYDSSSSSLPVLPSTTYDLEEYYGDVIPVPSTPRTLLANDRVKKSKKGQQREMEIVAQSEMPINEVADKGNDRDKERGRGIDIDIETGTETNTEAEAAAEKKEEAPVGASMAVLRARGHGYNSNITCLATHSLELENESRLYCAGDDCGGVSLWRIVPCTAPPPHPHDHPHARSHSKGQQRDCDRDREKNRNRSRSKSLEESKELGFVDEDDGDLDNDNNQDNEEGVSSITVASELQCFLNVNCLPRLPYASTHNSYTGTENRNNEEKDGAKEEEKVVEKEERVVTLQFLPNSELLLVGTNKRLLLIVVGAAATATAAVMQVPAPDPGPDSGICGDVWNVYIDPLKDSSNAFSPQAREQSLSHWLSQSPTPYKRQYMNMYMNTHAVKDSEMTFISWIELDQVPPYCDGIFSMSVGPEGGQGGSEHGSGSGSEQGQGQEQEMSIFLWKVIVQSEVPLLDRDVSVSDMLEAAITPAQLDAHAVDKPQPSTVKPDKSQGGTIFSFFSSSAPAPALSSTASNSVSVRTAPPTPAPVLVPAPAPVSVPVPVPAPARASPDTVTPKKPALNLNLKEEKETPCMNNDSKNTRTTARSNFDVDVDDLPDCRVYRLKWTEEMFQTAFKNSKAIPQHALEDHLSKIF